MGSIPRPRKSLLGSTLKVLEFEEDWKGSDDVMVLCTRERSILGLV